MMEHNSLHCFRNLKKLEFIMLYLMNTVAFKGITLNDILEAWLERCIGVL
jgi:hypothetical protein